MAYSFDFSCNILIASFWEFTEDLAYTTEKQKEEEECKGSLNTNTSRSVPFTRVLSECQQISLYQLSTGWEFLVVFLNQRTWFLLSSVMLAQGSSSKTPNTAPISETIISNSSSW